MAASVDEARPVAQDSGVIHPGDIGSDGPRIWGRAQAVADAEDHGILAQFKRLGWFTHSAIGLAFLVAFVWIKA